ncbi:replication regulatory protein RepA [Serratia sp. PF2-63]|uniref:replication regulatory protein RepA n=1 Tax=Enterobacterales TaxID=91347 RepID=UPI0024B5CA13|nr:MULTISPECIES: replication regulatory protein RepA [Enterobacterales]MDI9223645.1 replication regulatory protein RepA [Pantoea sp. EA-12]MDI9265883.1 replication regulatory protein RepA [Serratia sp. PF2-63]MDI9267149.1 replication regulatory protein RepA [Serratia sp. PF-27]
MSQHTKEVTSSKMLSVGAAVPRRPLTDSEKQLAAVARKRKTHKELKVFVRNPLKDLLVDACTKEGITQAQYIERLLEKSLNHQ